MMMTMIYKKKMNWEYGARVALDQSITHNQYLEHVALGPEHTPYVHIVLPTCFGWFMDELRDEQMEALYAFYTDNLEATVTIKRQEMAFRTCAMCAYPLTKRNNRIPYQLALHVVGGCKEEGQTPPLWRYDVLAGVLCRKCQTCSWTRLLSLYEDTHGIMTMMISQHCFQDRVPVPACRDEFLSEAVSKNYLERLQRLNEASKAIYIQRLMRRFRREDKCDHCHQEMHHHNGVSCRSCKGAFQWCSDGDACNKAVQIYHQCCKDTPVFYMDDVLLYHLRAEECKKQ